MKLLGADIEHRWAVVVVCVDPITHLSPQTRNHVDVYFFLHIALYNVLCFIVRGGTKGFYASCCSYMIKQSHCMLTYLMSLSTVFGSQKAPLSTICSIKCPSETTADQSSNLLKGFLAKLFHVCDFTIIFSMFNCLFLYFSKNLLNIP